MNRLQILHRSSTPGRRRLAINAQRHRPSSLTSSSLSSSGLCHHHQTTNNQYYHSRSSFQFKRDGLHAALTSSIDTISSRHDRNNRNINNVYSTTGNANSIIHNFPSSRRNYHSTPTTTLSTKTITPIDLLSSCPEFTPTLYGLSGLLLTTFHTQLHLPYWACISLTSIVVRTSIVPLVVQGAKTQLNFGKVAPEVQYLISMFQNDFKKLKLSSGAAGGGDTMQNKANQLTLVKYTLQTLRGVFRLHKVNLLDMFKSPLLQIPIFWYFSIDIRKIIHGSDPQLAQQLVESSFLWIPDLTEPDPWYGLPILTGMLLYLNVEMAMGRKALSGEASSRSNMGIMMKDFFQSEFIVYYFGSTIAIFDF